MKTLQVTSTAVLTTILCCSPALHAQPVGSTKLPENAEMGGNLQQSPGPLKMGLAYPVDEEDEYEISEAEPAMDSKNKAEQNSQMVTSKLKAIVLVGSPDLVNKSEYDKLTGVNIYEVDVPGKKSSLESDLEEFLNKPLDMKELGEIKRTIIMHYKHAGRPVIAVQVPEQDVTEGVVQFLVTEAKLGQVRCVGNKHFKCSRLKRYIKLKPGKPISETTLVENLNFMNRNPFRRTDAVYTPGEKAGTTDIELITQDRRTGRIYIGVDNTGLPKTGMNRWFTGFNWGNAFGLDQQLSYQYTTSSNFHDFQAHTANYSIPLPWQHMLIFYGGYSNVHAKLPSPGMGTHGNSYQASMRYDIPLAPIQTYLHEFIWGFDFKRTNNTVEFEDNSPVFGKNCNLTQLAASYNGGLQSRHNKTFVEGEIFYSPGQWVEDQTRSDYESLRPGAKPTYVYGRVSLVDVWYLPREFSVSGLFRGQLSSTNLLPSEQFGLGGYNTVRGYDERQVNGDNGVLLSGEVRSPVLGILKYVGNMKWKDGLQLLAFMDYGYANDHKAVPSTPKHQWLWSVGPGLRYNIDPYLAVRLDLGVKLHRHDFDGGPTRLHFSVIASY